MAEKESEMAHTDGEGDKFVPLLEVSATFTKEELLAAMVERNKEKARAIVCVNACKGIPTEKLREGIVGELIGELRGNEHLYPSDKAGALLKELEP